MDGRKKRVPFQYMCKVLKEFVRKEDKVPFKGKNLDRIVGDFSLIGIALFLFTLNGVHP